MSKHVKNIDFQNKRVFFDHIDEPEIKSSSDDQSCQEALALAAEKFERGPGVESEIEFFPSNDIIAKRLLFEVNEKSKTLGIEAKNQAVNGISNTMKVKVRNVTNRHLTILPDKIIGSLKIVKNAKECGIVDITNQTTQKQAVQKTVALWAQRWK